jgi:hypothetical protein
MLAFGVGKIDFNKKEALGLFVFFCQQSTETDLRFEMNCLTLPAHFGIVYKNHSKLAADQNLSRN